LFKVLKYLEDHGISNISVPVTAGLTYKAKLVKISSLSSRKIGLTPHHVGTIVEPPVVSRVPPSPDGETFHEFLVGMTEDDGIPMALDCAVAQFGLPSAFPYASEALVPYLRKLGTHRLLDDSESGTGFTHPFVKAKVEACTFWALSALKGSWIT
jgi:hypothetical protein